MKLFETVVIGCDWTPEMVKAANAIREILEAFNFRVYVCQLLHKWQVDEFFRCNMPECDHMVLCCHGMGDTEEDMKIMLQVIDQQDGDYSRKGGWFRTTLEITPSTLSQYVENAHGTFICIACGSGREPWGRAFLEAGFDAYIASEEDYLSYNGGILFVIGYFYHQRLVSADYFDRELSQEECVKGAAGMDSVYKYGTGLFRRYRNDDQ